MISTRHKITKSLTNKEYMNKLKDNIHFDIEEQFIEMFRTGGVRYSRKQIAAILGLSLSTLKNNLRDKGFSNKGNLKREDVKEILLEVYDIDLFKE